jgi:hypothetical protein
MPAATVAPVSPTGVKPRQVETHYTVRCFLYREKSGLFVAECVDLDLMVKARKQNMAMRALRDAVLGYVKVAVESGTDSELIPRRSPLSHRLHYYAVMIACRLSILGCERLFSCTPTTHTRCLA